MRKYPKVSVIMPFYNAENFLKESIESVLNQTFTDFEFIIINDASTDNSDTIVKKYLNKDKRIIYIKNSKNKWIVFNLNKWIELARWEYIARMDGDDISILDRFKKQVDFLDKNKDISIVWWNVILINEEDNEIWKVIKPEFNEDILKFVFLGSPFVHPSVMIRKEVFNKLGGYKEKYLYCEDYELWFRILYSWYKWANLDNYILKYRKHSNSSNKYSKLIAKRNFNLRKETIKKYNLNIWFKDYIWMYVHYILWVILTGPQKEKLEYFIKKIIWRW